MELKFKRILAVTLAGTMLLTGCNNIKVDPNVEIVENLSGLLLEDAPSFSNTITTADTDGDGYSDVIEDLAGTDKNVKETFTADNALTLVREVEGCTLELTGTPNIYSALVAEVDDVNLSNQGLLLSPVYEFNIDDFGSNIFSTTVSIKFNTKGLTEEEKANVSIYQYMPNGSLSKVDGCVVEGDTVTASLKHFSRYTVSFGDVLEREEYNTVAVCLAIDDSGSMYQFVDEELGLNFDISNGCAKDADGRRWVFAKEFIDAATASSDVKVLTNLVTFTNSHRICRADFDASLEDKHAAIDALANPDMKKYAEEKYFNGTAIGATVYDATGYLNSVKSSSKYIILLTDGADTTWYTTAYKSGLKENPFITPIIIGLGADVDEEYLKDIASYNRGWYIHLNDASALDILNAILGSIIHGSETIYFKSGNKQRVDITGLTATDNGDGTKSYSDSNGVVYDSVGECEVEVITDSGFRSELNSLPFDNFSCMNNGSQTGGYCYGLAELAQALYKNDLRVYDNYDCTAISTSDDFYYNTDKLKYRPLTPEMVTMDFSDYRTYPFAQIINMRNDIQNNWRDLHANGILVYDSATKRLNLDIEAYKKYNPYYEYYGYDGLTGFDTKNVNVYVDVNGRSCKVDYIEAPISDFNKVINRLFSGEVTDEKEYKSLICLYYAYLNWGVQHGNALTSESGLMQYYCLEKVLPCTDNALSFSLNDILHPLSDTVVPYGFFDGLTAELSRGIPASVGYKAPSGGHQVLCQRLLRSVSDPTVYYLEIYDDNTHDKVFYMTIDLDYLANSGKEILDTYIVTGSVIPYNCYAVKSVTFRGEDLTCLAVTISRKSDKLYSDVIVNDDGTIEYVK